MWVCKLDDPYGRAIANGLAQLAWQEDEQNWDDEKTTLDGQPFDLPEPERGIVWTRDDKVSVLPEEGMLEIHYRSTLRTPSGSSPTPSSGWRAKLVHEWCQRSWLRSSSRLRRSRTGWPPKPITSGILPSG